MWMKNSLAAKRSAGIAPDVNLRNLFAQVAKHASTKRTVVPQIFFGKKFRHRRKFTEWLSVWMRGCDWLSAVNTRLYILVYEHSASQRRNLLGMWLVECCKHVSLHSNLWVFCFTETQPSRDVIGWLLYKHASLHSSLWVFCYTETQPSRDRASSTRRSTWRTCRSTRRTVPSTSSSTTRYPGLSFSK